MQQWIYWGPHRDPHSRAFIPGMSWLVEHAMDRLAPLVVAPVAASPFVATVTRLPDVGLPGVGSTALSFRERWRTQLSPDPVASVFVTRGTDITPQDMLDGIRLAFPEVWTRFEKIKIGDICEQPSALRLSEASTNSTSKAEGESSKAKASAKSSA